MSVGGAGRANPFGFNDYTQKPEVESVEGGFDEEEKRREYRDTTGGPNVVATLAEGFARAFLGRRLTLPRLTDKTIESLPSFMVDAKESNLRVDLADVPDARGRLQPGVRISSPTLGATGDVAFGYVPGAPIRFSSHWGFGLPEKLAPHHAPLARLALDATKLYLDAAAAPGVPLRPGATHDEIAAAQGIAAEIEKSLAAQESIVARSPEAKLAADVWTKVEAAQGHHPTAELDGYARDLAAARGSVDGRSALTPEEKAAVKASLDEVLRVLRETREIVAHIEAHPLPRADGGGGPG